MKKYDTHIELAPAKGDLAPQGGMMRYGFKRHIGVVGFQKLINKWLKALLTEEGTDLSNRDYGTGFSSLIGANVSGRRDIQAAVEFAVDKATQDIKNYQADQQLTDMSEMLEEAVILAITTSPSGAEIAVRVQLKNSANESVKIQIPVKTTRD